MTKVRIKKVAVINGNGGVNVNYPVGAVVDLSDALAADLIAHGIAEAYTLVTPTGTKTVTANGTVDVSGYASVTVNVGTRTVAYNANGGTGTVTAETVIAGSAVTLNDGTGLTAPEGKRFAGWATDAQAEAADVTSPYTPAADVTLYAVWEDAPAAAPEETPGT